jgi:23S rRNA (guanosine2251-2'-O)-methyltransferase
MSDQYHYIYGLHAVEAALKYQPDEVQAIWTDAQRRDQRIGAILTLAKKAGVGVQTCRREQLDKQFPDARHQGVVAQVTPARSGNEQDLDQILAQQAQPFLLILDGVQDPHNLGACMRSAAAAGAHAIIVPKDRAVGLTATARKVASGAAEILPFLQVTNLARVLRDLQQAGVWLVGLAGDAGQSLYDCDLKGPLALVMGAEGEGMRRLTREHCDFLVHIPMAGAVESLNVSAATAVCLFEAVRQRSGA